MTTPNLDDVNDLVRRLRFDETRCEIQFSKGIAQNISEAADMLTRIASQRGDVIDREAIARVDDEDLMKLARKHFTEKQQATLTYAKWKDGIDIDFPTYNLRSFADAIIRSLPSREAIIEECAKLLDREVHEAWESEKHYASMNNIAHAIAEDNKKRFLERIASTIRSLAAQPRTDDITIPREKLLTIVSCIDHAMGDTDPSIDPDYTDEEVKRDYPILWVCQQLCALLKQPRSNSVEDGAGRNSSEDCSPQKAVIDTE